MRDREDRGVTDTQICLLTRKDGRWTVKQTLKQSGRQTGRGTVKQVGRQSGRQTGRKTESQAVRQSGSQTVSQPHGRPVYRQTVRKVCRQTDGWMDK